MTVAERRLREKDQRRDNTIIAASKLFYSKGYENVSMDEIAREAELGKTTLYNYFKDKESLLFAVIIQGSKIFRALLTEEEERMQNAGIMVGGLKNAWVRFALEYPEYAQSRVYFRAGTSDLMNNEIMNNDATEIFESSKEFFEKGILEINNGIENGIYKSDLDPVVVIALYVLIHDSIATISPDLRAILNNKGITVQQFFRKTLDLMDTMILDTEKEL